MRPRRLQPAGELVRGGGLVTAQHSFPELRQVVLDCPDARVLAEFYRRLLGLRYRPGDEWPPEGELDSRGQDWLVLQDATGTARLAFQQVAALSRVSWPEGPVPQQMHLDLTVPTTADLNTQHDRAVGLGARLLRDRSADQDEPLRVFADPAGHPFCIFVANAIAT
jgi:catechol 2,3-dioxygenase-like lactoylglutathione lyase family enzyme